MDTKITSSFDSFELQITPMAQGFLKETAKWAMFLSILGFIGLGFCVLFALMMFSMGGAMATDEMAGMEGMGGGMGAMAAMGGTFIGVVYLLIAVFYFFPVYYLYKFASNTKQAFANNNTEQLTGAFENLKSHYKFIGVLTIIGIALSILMIIFVAVMAGSAAAGM
ncbi:MAG: hypothetical protein EOO45_10310 [Flavobacterium sp.]|nr:MAG: hypothetical protein EOO45_10310 [Flavobacterium sp.]